jgi:GxxExxY protein
MNADERRYPYQDLTRRIIGSFFEVYNELGHGFLELIYKRALTIALEDRGLQVESDYRVTAHFRGRVLGEFRPDLVVNQLIIIELKAVRCLERAHEAQVLNYLRAGILEIGLLMNFGVKPQVRRLAFSNVRKAPMTPHEPPVYLRPLR